MLFFSEKKLLAEQANENLLQISTDKHKEILKKLQEEEGPYSRQVKPPFSILTFNLLAY